MAEGFLRHIAGDRFESLSAGTHPTTLNPLAVKVMAEVGIDISRQRSKGPDTLADPTMDVVVTVCDRANGNCPVYPDATARIHWSFEDPAEATGTEDQRMIVFRRVRDEIQGRIRAFLDAGRNDFG
jgi:arsenate reductase